MIKIQKKDFNLENEIHIIKSKYSNVGAVSTFVGYVRDINLSKKVNSINLEVYKEMAFKSLSTICETSQKKWNIIDTLIIHRYGKLNINQKIVLVATFSIHRKDSIEACDYIMNFLKKEAPFWKKEFYEKDSAWI
jgi:molybdopterin synthase catalytic subunit